jgi:O-antigen/teichoic acid export membrane protein
MFKYFRLKPFDTSDEQGRSAERHRRIALSAMWSVAGRLLTIIIPLVTIPLTLSYLGRERYGVWMTLSSITASLGFADLGVGLGLLNAISESNGKGDKKEASVLVSSAFYMLLLIAATLGAIYWLAAPHIPWGVLLKISTTKSQQEVSQVMAIFFACFLLNMPLGIVDRIYLGYQEGFASSIAQFCGSLFFLLGIVIVVRKDLGLQGLVLVSSGVPLLVLVANGYRLFARQRPWLIPRPALVQLQSAKKLLRIGSMFFVLQICAAVAYSSDNLVIAGIRGIGAVADYSVASKMFAIILSLVPMIVTPIWPALIEAASRNDVTWVRRTLYRVLFLVLVVVGPTALLLLLFAKTIIAHWTHGQLHPTMLVLSALAVWTIIGSIGNVTAMFMNAMSVIRFQVIASVLASSLNITLSILLTRRFGPAGVVLGSSISIGLFLFPVFFVVIPNVLRKLEQGAMFHREAATSDVDVIPLDTFDGIA